MDHRKAFADRNLAVRLWNVDARVIDSDLARLEASLAVLGSVKVKPIRSLDDNDLPGCDLLIVAAQSVPADDFSSWLQQFVGRMKKAGHIWTPALLMAQVNFSSLSEILPQAVQENWYFDVIDPNHLASLPIRVANLLRIHDHLRELHRYEAALGRLENQVETLNQKLATLPVKSEDGP